ncbi:GH32 C-terminal domain-containing protein [Clostridium beijerinckii]|uniref:Glycosyl hydrolase family 32 n=1 Tax=Clostridium beijerinckii TaxID=1520 RepID=A0AAW3WG24_CLOBE|nr:GH32 C-terminal domain-containing protein [Clostridium beijerinckii]MBC2459900.1 glycosyl hydrolase family 32 [Clostridium beijerinckii]MBC2477408.1 glycosyl hydrolase family 32 [Clostridium beijerinckii]NOV61440.1 fructan beta-fructosidase [Clostridium beijerinckii]NOV69066.1 fructan beta-fructosidase [Clostridium beijerinckii]NOW32694.1 fructan beta-fructosidase [Clostridium beijerinckii]
MKKLKLKLIAITVATMTTATLTSVNASAAWIQNEGNWNYLSDSGEMKTGWVNDNGAWYYLDNSGTMKTGWVNDSGTWYYMQPSGEMKTGWVNDNGTWYYLDNSGTMKTGWVNDSGTWYYMQPSGAMKTGWINDNGKWYFAAVSGAMQTGVVQVDDKIYYLDAASGSMQVGNVTISRKNYTFALTGEAVGKDIPPVSKAFNSNGIGVTDTNNSGKNNNSSNTSTTSQESDSSGSNHHSSGSSNNGSSGNNGGGSDNSGGGDINAGVSTSYLENYREQYHFSVAKAWGNDPNGMVYFNGEYHLFYQYYPDDVVWGPMHWGHAVSTDLVHWKELGIAIAPGDVSEGDGRDWIYSGSAVVDKDNTSGFFDGIEGGGLVAIYTQHIEDNPKVEEQCVAYSKDNGRTWIKYKGNSEKIGSPVLSVEDDPLQNRDFRDPKVFYNEEAHKWMMAVAGGPLRFFSSTDLKNWKPEAMQPEITTECPDFYKLKVEGTDEEKWVLSEGGRYYRVGDFKEVDGVWTFVPDNDDHIPMNFAKDAYAAQTYYGKDENGTPDGRRIMINWMNNWDYCQSIGKITNTFNGQYTLQNELKLVNTADGIRLVQQPIKEYESLRQSPTTFNNVTISPDQPNIMSNIQGSQYEIVAEFEPDEKTTEVGFKLRVGKDAGQETIVKYNTKTEEVTLDRSKSGKAPSNSGSFLQSYSSKMNKTADGKIQLHIFVDASSVEVYGDNGEVTGTAQIFPNRTSQGIEVYSLGGNAKATINYYPLKGIWNNDVKGTNSVALSLSESNFTKEVGEQFTIYTTTIPTTAAQGVNWTISDPSIVKIISQDDTKTTFEVTGKGTTDLTATSKDGKSIAKANLSVYNRTVTSDISDLANFQSFGGNWYVENNAYIGDGAKSGDGFAISDQMSDPTATYTFTADAKILDGGDVADLVLLSKERDASKGSIVANIIKDGTWRVFDFPGGKNILSGHIDPAPDNIYRLKVELKGNHIKYWINDEFLGEGDQSSYDAGYFGLGVCNAKVEFTNVRLNKAVSDTSTLELNKTAFEQSKGDTFTVYSNQKVNWSIADPNVVQLLSKDDNKATFEVVNSGATTLIATSATNSNLKQDVSVDAYERDPETVDGLVEGLTNFQTHNGNWYVKNDAYEVNVSGDGFSTSDNKINIEENPDTTYTLEADANILSGDVAELVLFAQSKDNPQGDGGLIANVIRNNTYNLFTFGKGGIKSGDLDDSGKSTDGKYHLKAEVKGTHLKYTINNQVIYDGEQNFFTSGYLGLGACNAKVAFTNIKFTDSKLDDDVITSVGNVTVTTDAAVKFEAPVTGETPVSTIDDTDQYTATIEWNENPAIFEANKVYSATITIKPKAGYTIIGVPKDYFKVDGAIATNDADSGVIKAVFPETN